MGGCGWQVGSELDFELQNFSPLSRAYFVVAVDSPPAKTTQDDRSQRKNRKGNWACPRMRMKCRPAAGAVFSKHTYKSKYFDVPKSDLDRAFFATTKSMAESAARELCIPVNLVVFGGVEFWVEKWKVPIYLNFSVPLNYSQQVPAASIASA